jgi:SseB protein N-terminal domain
MIEEPPDTEHPSDAGHVYVPMQAAACGVSLRLFRDRDGARCAVGFTSPDRLAALLGGDQQYYRVTVRVARAMARERGVTALVVDPGLVAAPVSTLREIEPVPAETPAPPRVGAARTVPDRQTVAI